MLPCARMTQLNEAFIRALQDRIDANNQRSDPYDVTACIENAGLAYAISIAKTMLVDEGLWRPIETAPRDGTRILIKILSGKQQVVRWERYGLHSYWTIYSHADNWINRLFSKGEKVQLVLSEDTQPTHWMPLPASPGERASAMDEGIGEKVIPPRSMGSPPSGRWGGDYQTGWDDAVRACTAVVRRPEILIEDAHGHNQPCYYCGEPINSLAANPSRWGIALCHKDDPGVVKWHHTGCICERLIENQPYDGSTEQQLREALIKISKGRRTYEGRPCKDIAADIADAALALPAGQPEQGVVGEDIFTIIKQGMLAARKAFDANPADFNGGLDYEDYAAFIYPKIRPHLRNQPISANLFKAGSFTSHSGLALPDKIDCDALTDADWQALAAWFAERIGFRKVVGIETGGNKLAEALQQYVSPFGPVLIVDDVLTTGRSMEEARQQYPDAVGGVLFARGEVPDWIIARFHEAGTRSQPIKADLEKCAREE